MKGFIFIGFILLLISCSPGTHHMLRKEFILAEESFQDYKGCLIYDLQTKDTIFQFHADRYFTPASNTKIFTLYSGLMVLRDSVPAFRYQESGDSLIVWGTGDPSFLNEKVYQNEKVYEFLKNHSKNLYFSASNFYTTPFGPGWSWEDYDYDFSCERSPFPVYGNTFNIKRVGTTLSIQPSYFDRFLHSGDSIKKSSVKRAWETNEFIFQPDSLTKLRTWRKPYKVNPEFIAELLSDTLKREVKAISRPLSKSAKTYLSIPADSLYKPMMQESDNFLAEQILLLCSSILSDSLSTDLSIDFMMKNYFKNMPDQPIWRDGSGLSRYNLVTPRSIAWLWNQLYEKVPKERLFAMLATGGEAGTIKNLYKADKPYIYGKTGTLSHVHCLSGFLITKKGRVFVFTLMNTNYTTSAREVRFWMEGLLQTVHDNY